MKPMHIAMALLSAAMFLSGGRLYGRATGAGWHQTGGRHGFRHPLAVGVYRHGGGLFFQLLRPAFQKGLKRFRTEVYSARD